MATTNNNLAADIERVNSGARTLREEMQSIGTLLGVFMTRLVQTILPENHSDIVVQFRWLKDSLIFSLFLVPINEIGQPRQTEEVLIARGELAPKIIDFRRSFPERRISEELIREKTGPLVVPFLFGIFKDLGWGCEYRGDL